jgi:hypothetical protein
MTRQAVAEHPAVFGDAILATIAPHVAGLGVVVDPFAGVGKVHRLRDLAGVHRTIGVELEPEWACAHPDTIVGDARDISLAMLGTDHVDGIVVSPTYGNRMADHHNANDPSHRNTYKHRLGRDLTPGNSGAMPWGDEYRALHQLVWQRCVDLSPTVFVLNVKDHVRRGERQRVTAWHVDQLTALGLRVVAWERVPTRGNGFGANGATRVPYESVVVLS